MWEGYPVFGSVAGSYRMAATLWRIELESAWVSTRELRWLLPH